MSPKVTTATVLVSDELTSRPLSRYYLPSEEMTMMVLLNSGADIPGSWMMIQDITRIISPNNLWPGLPK
jgi:hypothetical protein